MGWTQSKLHTSDPTDQQGKRRNGRNCCHGPEWNSYNIFLWRCSCFVALVEILVGY
jgi:hypothetical protein